MSNQFLSVYTRSVLALESITAGTFIQATGFLATSGGNTYGVARQTTTSGNPVAVDALGSAPVLTGGPIALGASIQVGANSRAITRHGTNPIVGRALEAATQSGEIIEAFLIPN